DFAVALGTWAFSSDLQKSQSFAGTIMHELGHNLGLRHGGGAGIDCSSSVTPCPDASKLSANCKPNYLSVMSYALQMPDRPVPIASWKLDYSRIQLPPLNESSLNEALGVFGNATNQTALTGFFTAFGLATKSGATQITPVGASGPINYNGDRVDPSFETGP